MKMEARIAHYGKGLEMVRIENQGRSTRGLPNKLLSGFRSATGIEIIELSVANKRCLSDIVLKRIASNLIGFFKSHETLKGTVKCFGIVSKAGAELQIRIDRPNGRTRLTIEGNFDAANPTHQRMLEENIRKAGRNTPTGPSIFDWMPDMHPRMDA